MYSFAIPDMTCGHCVSVITQAVKGEDVHAVLTFDLKGHTVQIQSSAHPEELVEAIEASGYWVARVVPALDMLHEEKAQTL